MEQGYLNNIVHEAELQRQYIRIEIPSSITINGKSYPMTDLSAGGFRIKGKDNLHLFDTRIEQGEIAFNFDNFTFGLKISAEAVYKNEDHIGFRFCDLNREQSSMLRHVIRSFLSGHIFSTSEVLNVVSRNNYVETVRKRKFAERPFHHKLLYTYMPMTCIMLAGIIALLLLVGNIYESTRLVKSYSAAVDGDVITMRARTNGVFRSNIPDGASSVVQNQIIGSFLNTDNANAKEEELKSPCDCVIAQQSAQEGDFKVMGEALFKLFPETAEPVITAVIRSDQLHRLKMKGPAKIRISGMAGLHSGRLVQFLPQDGDFAKVKIRPDKSFKPEWFGKPAYVEIDTF